MIMKKYILLLVVWVAFSCTPDDSVDSATHNYAGIRISGLASSILEDAGAAVQIPVYFGGEIENPESFTVSYTITGGVYGDDYTVVGGTGATGSVTVPAGATGSTARGLIQVLPVADLEEEDDVTLKITLNETSNGNAIGYPLKGSFSLKIEDDDCALVEADFVPQTAQSREVYTSSTYPGSGTTCEGVASRYCTDFTKIADNEWEMDNLWNAGWVVTVNVDPATLTVSIPETQITDFGSDWTITGEGTISTCGKKIIITIHLTDTVYGYDDYQFVQEYYF